VRAASDSAKTVIDPPATILDLFDLPLPPDMQGMPLKDSGQRHIRARGGALWLPGGHVNVTDGRYVFMRAPATKDNQPLFNYTF
jgi:anaerobic glycerol-3-phosphate dehydrogenase